MASTNSLLISQLYVGYFNRAPDPEGLNYWVGRLDAGMTLVEIANSFAVQVEATTTYPWLAAPNLDVGIPEFITQVYQNLFERNPDAAGLAFWTNELKNGKPPGRFIIDVISGATGDDKLVIDHKTEVGNYYADQALLRGLQWNTNDDLAGAAAVMDGDRAFWVSNASLVAGKAAADAIITEQLEGPVGTIALTTGIDIVTVHANETVVGNDLTWNPGDKITGASGTVDINYGSAVGPFFGTINNVDLVNLTTTGATVQVATNWTNVDEISVKQSTGALRLDDLQASSNDAPAGQTFTNYAVRDFVTANTVTFNFDVQAVDKADTNVNLAVREVTGGILLNSVVGQAIENVSISIEDVAGFTSKIASFSAQGIQTLNIAGGAAGLPFEIVAPLDAGLKTINASKAASNLTLDVSNSTEAMSITMGSGDDYLKTGDTLSPLVGPGADTLVGGPGTDTVEAIFTTAGTRQPIMSGFEVANVTFNNNATWNFSDTNDLHTINVATSTHRIALHDMDSTVSTINVTGLQAPGAPGGPGTARHDFWWVEGKAVTMNWTSKVAEDSNAGELYFRDIQTVTFNHSGPFDTRFIDSIPDGDDSVFQFDESLLSLTINNKGTGDMYLLGGDNDETIAATSKMQTLSINATGGDIAISGDVDTILSLRTLNLSAAGGNYLALDDIGTPVDDIDGGTGIGERLEIVNMTTGSNSTIDMDQLRADKSTISTITVNAGNDSDINVDEIHAQDISEFNVTLAEESTFNFGAGNDIFMVNQGDNFVVKGAGFLSPVDFATEAFAFMDFSGMTVNGVNIDWQDAKAGSKVIGTKFADNLDAGSGNDNIDSGLGNDDVFGNAGDDVLTDLGGDNELEGGKGVDIVNLKLASGTDVIEVGFLGPLNSDTVNGFDINFDRVRIDTGDVESGPITQVIRGDGTNIGNLAPTDVDIQTVNAASDIADQTDILSITGTYATLAVLEQALEFGGTRELRNAAANQADNEAFLIHWTDTSNNSHISAARIIDEVPLGGGNVAFNFDIQDMVVLTGVPAVNHLNFETVA